MGYDVFECSRCSHSIVEASPQDITTHKYLHYIMTAQGAKIFSVHCKVYGCGCNNPTKANAEPAYDKAIAQAEAVGLVAKTAILR